ncbi:MAG TPA: hypothetical protein VK427_14025 [Kofleriaceae bacterium]|nr:hypothetical protein [Kofleriaceae bacterium]
MRCALLIAAMSGGCFYMEPINQRPSLDIRQDSVGPVYRGQNVSFTAVAVDPDGHDVDVTWRVYACTDATSFSECDATSVEEGDGQTFKFTVPTKREDGRAVQGIRIVLDGKDSRGATSKPADQLQLPVLDQGPELGLRKDSIYSFVVGTPVDIYAEYSDADDELDTLAVNWTVFSPSQVSFELVDKPISQEPGNRKVHKVLTPAVVGEWSVEVRVADKANNVTTERVTLNVVPDGAPCIATVSPLVSPPGVVAQIFEPTVFEAIVKDDLDSSPQSTGGALFGTASHRWTVLGPTGGRQVMSTGRFFAFDPDVYIPGTIVEVRVEVQDRKLTPVSCADADATCSTSASSCIQRQTWRVEAR